MATSPGITKVETHIWIRRGVPDWAKQCVSFRNKFPHLNDYQSILSVLGQNSRNLSWSVLGSSDGTDCVLVNSGRDKPVVFVFESGLLMVVALESDYSEGR